MSKTSALKDGVNFFLSVATLTVEAHRDNNGVIQATIDRSQWKKTVMLSRFLQKHPFAFCGSLSGKEYVVILFDEVM